MVCCNCAAQHDKLTEVKGGSGKIIQHSAYTVSLNTKENIPHWVSWYLDRKRLAENVSRKGVNFKPDPNIDEDKAVVTQDYSRSGYDRGHMCPAGDCRWNHRAMRESFYTTNICPQNPKLNGGDWHELEQSCRRWGHKERTYIVCGPILYKKPVYGYIGKFHKIRVPEAFFKVVLTGLESGKPKAIGYIFKNTEGNLPLSKYVNSVDQVERITGFDFFSSLPDDIEAEVEKQCNPEHWR